MKYLKDDVRLSELSIPGTHETMSFFGGDAVQCQSMGLNFQLESGIRALDIRCAIEGNGFDIYHGGIYQKANFDDVLTAVVNFLKKHPSETVLMRVKQERTDQPGRFFEIFRDKYWNHPNYKDYMWNIPTRSQNPTLGEMRGKIVILQDFARWQCESPDSKAEFGLCYNDHTFVIQDSFRLGTNNDLYPKWEAVKAQLHAANFGAPDDKYINYLSGSGGSFPYFVVSGHSSPQTGAPRLNTLIRASGNSRKWVDFPRLPQRNGFIYYEGTNTLTYGSMRPGGEYRHRVGIIMTDFPGWGLINRIIDLNWEGDLRNRPTECNENRPSNCGRSPRHSK